MNFFPYKNEQIELPYSAVRAEALLYEKLADVLEKDEEIVRENKEELFTGMVKNGEFSISLVIKHPQSFIPMLTGRIDSTANGCVVHCTYHLFWSTKLFLSFWVGLTLAIALFFTIFKVNYFYAMVAAALCLGNYFIASSNFHLHYKRTHQTLLRVFIAGNM